MAKPATRGVVCEHALDVSMGKPNSSAQRGVAYHDSVSASPMKRGADPADRLDTAGFQTIRVCGSKSDSACESLGCQR